MIMKTNTGYLSAHKTPAPSCGAPLRCCETCDSGGCKLSTLQVQAVY